jgi:DNA-binding transcriptional ArsR family regulator
LEDFALVRSAAAAKSLVHPLRRKLLEVVREPSSAAAVARRLGMRRQVVNYHFRALEKNGLVCHVQDVKTGNCVERMLQAVAREFVIAPSVYGRAHGAVLSEDRFSVRYAIASSLQTIEDLAMGIEAAGLRDESFSTLTLEAEVHFESAAAQTGFAREAVAAFEAIARKYRRPGGRRSFSMKLLAYSTGNRGADSGRRH